jgi:hypothetical protein
MARAGSTDDLPLQPSLRSFGLASRPLLGNCGRHAGRNGTTDHLRRDNGTGDSIEASRVGDRRSFELVHLRGAAVELQRKGDGERASGDCDQISAGVPVGGDERRKVRRRREH